MQLNDFNRFEIDFGFILKSVPGYVYWKDRNSVYLGCNQNVADLIGLANADDIVGKTEFDLPWGKISEIVDKSHNDDQRVIKTGTSFITEDRLDIKNGQGLEIILRTEKAPLFDKEKNIIGVLGVGVDITMQKHLEQKKIEQAIVEEKKISEKILNEQESIYSSLESAVSQITGQVFFHRLPAQEYIDEIHNFLTNIILKMPGYVYFKDKNFKYLFCNEIAAKELLGFSFPSEIIGKTDYDFGWNKELVDEYRKIDEEIIKTGQPRLGIEEVVYTNKGEPLCFHVNKMPLFNKTRDIIGIIGVNIDITGQKEAERLRLGFELHKSTLEEQAKFKEIVDQVAHDIRSPLASLMIITKVCQAIPERERVALREVATTINDIANYLLSQYNKKNDHITSDIEEHQPILVSSVLLQIQTEKKFQYQHLPVEFHHAFSQAGNFSLIHAAPTAFKRMMSNLINNAVDALERKAGTILLHLDANDEEVQLIVEDNGNGMTPALINKIMQAVVVTEGKQDGHGIGLNQVRETLRHNHGQWHIESQPDTGTKVIITFPRSKSNHSYAEHIHVYDNDTLVILDDDNSIHVAWNLRFQSYLNDYPYLIIRHFTVGQEAVDFINNMDSEKKSTVFLLTDYELLSQELNGLQVIQLTNVSRSVLVTSHYANPSVLSMASTSGVKILPKQLASDVPISIRPAPKESSDFLHNRLKETEVIFVDDDEALLTSLAFLASGKKVKTYQDPRDFLKDISHYPHQAHIFVDHHFDNADQTGIEIIEQLTAAGFLNVYLLSGGNFSPTKTPPYLKIIMKTDINQVFSILHPNQT